MKTTSNDVLMLVYFPARGECDKVRLLLAETGLNFVELNVTGKSFALNREDYPLCELPVLEDSNVRMCGAMTIMNYIGEKMGMFGDDLAERALISMWCEKIEKIQQGIWQADFLTAASSTSKMQEAFCKEYLYPELTILSNAMMKNDSPFLVKGAISIADIYLFSLLESIEKELPSTLLEFPLLTAFRDCIADRPNISRFMDSPRRF
eukprot:TRINITY_DN1166_c1_g1_i5.p1 TRINITY_DN1166_c1_g1~~TRINITY_DN1166_c1_g1_i5.p1  ORF type:complete len:207 (+),score=35.43 TRINITY_DN1166_c1_g1_i5:1023-1643(+)